MRMPGWKTGKNLLLVGILLLSALSCRKIQSSVIPDVPFSFTINLIIVNELNIPGNSTYFPGPGYGGVIVYCEAPGTWYAYDATCPYEISKTCKVINDGVLGECECCESQFILIGGAYPAKGPATMPLKYYQVSQVNSTTLRIYN